MDSTTWTLDLRPISEQEAILFTCLYQTLQGLCDPRRKQGKWYELALLQYLLILAKLVGQPTLSAVTQWIRHRGGEFSRVFGLRRSRMPCQMIYCNVLAQVDGKHLDELLSAFFVRWEARASMRRGTEPTTDTRWASRAHPPGHRWQVASSDLLATSYGASTQLL